MLLRARPFGGPDAVRQGAKTAIFAGARAGVLDRRFHPSGTIAMQAPQLETDPAAYWGKADARNADGYHLLPYHALDVAAVGVAMLRQSAPLRGWMQQSLPGFPGGALEAWLGFFLALHDLGKFSEAFQSQRADLMQAKRGRAPDPGKPYGRLRHDSLGWLIWKQLLEQRAIDEAWFGPHTEALVDYGGLDWWMQACTGHHGTPPQAVIGRDDWRHYCNAREDAGAIRRFVGELSGIFSRAVLAEAAAALDAEAFAAAGQTFSWWLAGLVVLADWLGSNTDFFPYCSAPMPLADYWVRAQAQAGRALQASGLLTHPGAARDFSALFPRIARPSPLQAWAIAEPLTATPQIHLLEDVTGAGKTEAAVMLAHRLIAAGAADGFFVGLPTMATANAMYGRIAEVYRQLFAGDASLVLAHGQSRLVEDFAASVLPADQPEADPQQLDETASARCAAWLADHAKRALLSPAGVGTIDQVLLAVLTSRHQCLRLLGLLRKVLVVDEVHACDAYMQRVLETVLSFHARAGGSAILLSATLPEGMKQALLDAFARGRGQQAAPALSCTAFPLATSWRDGAGALQETPVATRDAVRRQLAVRYVSDEAVVLFAIRSALAEGRCVCWMRNTVTDALAAYAQFQRELPAERLILFHARFTLGDRLETEQRVLASFGKDSGPAERAGKLVIATQVAEQSLDADWDFVVSDLAPIDRLIQRAGRLQRHPRDAHGRRLADPAAVDQRGQACLWVFGPAWSDSPPADWFKHDFPGAARVYPHHGQLWLTARALQQGQLSLPEDARSLVESVFGPEAEIPEALEANSWDAEGKALADRSEGQQNTIKLANGYSADGSEWWSEARTPSRLGEATVNVLLVRWVEGRLEAWNSDAHARRAWAYSSLRMAERQICARCAEADPAREHALQALLESLPDKGKWSVLLVLDAQDGAWRGRARAPARGGDRDSGPVVGWRYDAVAGLVREKAPGE